MKTNQLEIVMWVSVTVFMCVILFLIVNQFLILRRDRKDRLNCLAFFVLMPKISIFILGIWVITKIIFKEDGQCGDDTTYYDARGGKCPHAEVVHGNIYCKHPDCKFSVMPKTEKK